MYALLLTLHIIISIVLVVVILVQHGKSAGLGGMFGGGSSDALFSAPSGNIFIKKVTIGFFVALIGTTLLLTVLSSRKTSQSVIQRVAMPQ